MDLMDHKSQMMQMLLDMLQKSSGDEMQKDLHPSGLNMNAEKEKAGMSASPVDRMAEGGIVSPNVDTEDNLQAPETSVRDQVHPEEEPEDVPAIARFRRRT